MRCQNWATNAVFLLQLLVPLFAETGFDGYYRIRQESSGRYLDAYDQDYKWPGRPGYEVVARPMQYAPVRDGIDKTQVWYILQNEYGSYSMMQYTSGRFLDVITGSSEDNWKVSMAVVTKPANDSLHATSQRWLLQHVPADPNITSVPSKTRVHIVHAGDDKFLDAHHNVTRDYQASLESKGHETVDCACFGCLSNGECRSVAKTIPTPSQSKCRQNNGTWCQAQGEDSKSQTWVLEKINDSPVPFLDGVFTVTQEGTGKLLDADQTGRRDCFAKNVTFNETQHFIIRRVKGEIYTIMQASSGRFLGAKMGDAVNANGEAEVSAGLVHTDNTQQWMMIFVKYETFLFQHVASGRILDATQGTSQVFGAFPLLATYDGNITNELWKVKRIAFAPKLSGIYRFTNDKYDKVLDGGAVAGGTLQIQPKNGLVPTQYFVITQIEGDIYEIYSNKSEEILRDKNNKLFLSGKEVDVPTALLQTGTVPLVAAEHPTEQWFLKWAGGDNWYVLNPNNNEMLDADESGKVFSRPFSRSGAQVWKIEIMGKQCADRLKQCPDLYRCGFIDDWCGGKVACGLSFEESYDNGTCKDTNSVTGTAYTCNDEHVCQCTPKNECRPGACNTEEADGCGGSISCGACPPPMPAPAPMPMFAPAPAPFAWQPFAPLTSTTITTTCLSQCTMTGWQCGFVPDGCGGMVPCGEEKGLCPKNPIEGAGFACSSNYTCACTARTTCDKNATCGEQPDGCGGMVQCGSCTNTTNWACSAENTCVCTPDECGARCGDPVDDGCGKKLQCKCTMANEVCDRGAGICRSVPGPTPDPSLFAPTTTTTATTTVAKPAASPAAAKAAAKEAKKAAEKKKPGAPGAAPAAAKKAGAPEAPGAAPAPGKAPEPAPAPAPAPMPIMAPAPAPTGPTFKIPAMPKGLKPPPNLAPNMVEYWQYFYYLYYYYSYLNRLDHGATPTEAAVQAQKMAPAYAYEQLKHMFNEREMEQLASRAEEAMAGPMPEIPVVPPGMPPLPTATQGMPPLPAPPGVTALHAVATNAKPRFDASRQQSQRSSGLTVLLQSTHSFNSAAWDRALAAAASRMQAVALGSQDSQTAHVSRRLLTARPRSALRGVPLSASSVAH